MQESFEQIAAELILMRDYDLNVRDSLAESGELAEGYNQQMENVHQQNALRLEMMMEEHGWLTAEKVGAEANEAALLIVLHAISLPQFQRQTADLIKAAVDEGKEEPANYAFLSDRICFHERRPQLFGTQYDWDEQGLMSPWKLLSPERVDALRLAMGLGPIDAHTTQVRASVAESGEQPPADFAARQREIENWCRATGWIS